MSKLTYPPEVQDRIRKIVQMVDVDQSEVTEELDRIYNSSYVQDDSQFPTAEEKYRYSSAVLWARYISRPPAIAQQIIPFGFGGIRVSRAGKKTSEAYVIVREGSPPKTVMRRLSLTGTAADKITQINPFYLYNVKLGQFRGGDLIGDDRAIFKNPRRVNINPIDVLENQLGYPRVTIAQAARNPSRERSDGYQDRTDWRILRAIIARSSTFTREDGTIGGVYTLSDFTVERGEESFAGMTGWIAPFLMSYQDFDEVDACGPISVDDDGVPSMNIYCILPVHVKKGE